MVRDYHSGREKQPVADEVVSGEGKAKDEARGEEQPPGVPHPQTSGFFSKLKDAFAGR